MKKVIVLGQDHTNSLGVVQCLGRVGYYMIAVVWGVNTGLVKSSKYTKEAYGFKDEKGCVDFILQNFVDESVKIPIIACCDSAALALDDNAEKLKNNFVFEYSSKYNLEYLMQKENQVMLAIDAKFNVPKTWNLGDSKNIPNDVIYPCLIKPLVSCEGAKSDIRVCRTEDELNKNLDSLVYTKEILLQQYIERDYEISILGCALKGGEVIIPCVENKLTLYPKNVGLECLSNMQPLIDKELILSIKSIIDNIGYVGVFSVEMMHSKVDNKFYFTEINLRNDGANAFVYKYGVNLLQNHVEDLLDDDVTIFSEFNPGYYIWEMHHFLSLIHLEISFFDWVKEICKSRNFLTYYPEDKKPFYKQFIDWFLLKLHIKRYEHY